MDRRTVLDGTKNFLGWDYKGLSWMGQMTVLDGTTERTVLDGTKNCLGLDYKGLSWMGQMTVLGRTKDCLRWDN